MGVSSTVSSLSSFSSSSPDKSQQGSLAASSSEESRHGSVTSRPEGDVVLFPPSTST